MTVQTHTANYLQRTTFTLNEKDVFIGFDDNWNKALLEPVHSLETEHLLGNSLFNYVTGDATQIWVGAMIQKARVMGACEAKYRCDSPEEIRWCKMTMKCLNNKHLLVEHFIVNKKKRAQVPDTRRVETPLGRKAQIKPGAEEVIVCSNCCSIMYDKFFVEMFDYCVLIGCTLSELFKKHTCYTVCPECIQVA